MFSGGSADLHNCLRRELEEEHSRDDRVAEPACPSGWGIRHTAGNSYFTMTRTYNDELIELFCRLQLAPPAVDGADKAPEFPFRVVVTRSGKAAEFICGAIENELVLDGVAHYDDPQLAKNELERENKYQGPVLHELTDNVLDSFLAYLRERGVDDLLAEFVTEYSFWMEQQEYEAWLAKMADFTE